MNSILKYGIGAGLALGILVVTGYTLDWYKVSFTSGWMIINLIIMIFSIYYGVKEIRKNNYTGNITYKKALLEGLKIVCLFTFIHSLSIFMYFTLNEKKFNEYKAYTNAAEITAMKQAGYTQEQINSYTKMERAEFTPFFLTKINSIIDLLFGLVVALIVASFLREKDQPPLEVKNP